MKRKCGVCKQVKPVTEFNWRKADKGIRDSYCRECRSAVNREYAERRKLRPSTPQAGKGKNTPRFEFIGDPIVEAPKGGYHSTCRLCWANETCKILLKTGAPLMCEYPAESDFVRMALCAERL